ncbi:hypothetical protein HYS91_01085 [Candidatus Daviesbacteria bacterium]|nr:hypothetical protein [Candidatus Daviesbacteria bacterium]
MKKFLPILVIFSLALIFPYYSLARVTPEDIVNSQKETFESKIKNYSLENQNKIKSLVAKIETINKQRTQELELIVQTQGLILDEYVRRNNIQEDGGKDGIHRSNDPVAVVRIEITRAHEAVAYQAAKNYIPSLTSESNMKSNLLNLINKLEYELNSARSQVIKSQNILKGVISE